MKSNVLGVTDEKLKAMQAKAAKLYPLTKAVRDEAETTVTTTPAEAAKLPGFLGRLASTHPEVRGWYGCRVGGVKTLFVRKES